MMLVLTLLTSLLTRVGTLELIGDMAIRGLNNCGKTRSISLSHIHGLIKSKSIEIPWIAKMLGSSCLSTYKSLCLIRLKAYPQLMSIKSRAFRVASF
jgi:hypothetical protein